MIFDRLPPAREQYQQTNIKELLSLQGPARSAKIREVEDKLVRLLSALYLSTSID
jgi:hypothetical protein